MTHAKCGGQRTIPRSPPPCADFFEKPVTQPILSSELPGDPTTLRVRASLPPGCATKPKRPRPARPRPACRRTEREKVIDVAADLVSRVRRRAKDQSVVESFMRQYDLSSEEGVLLMCVAEALLRIPDKATADKLIRDKLGDANWKKHLGQSESVLRQRLDLGG